MKYLLSLLVLCFAGFVAYAEMPPNPYPLPVTPIIPSCPGGTWDAVCLRRALEKYNTTTANINANASREFVTITLTFEATMVGAQTAMNQCLSTATTTAQRDACRAQYEAIRNLASTNYWANSNNLMQETRAKLDRARVEASVEITRCCNQ
jgi:hypothetical protein